MLSLYHDINFVVRTENVSSLCSLMLRESSQKLINWYQLTTVKIGLCEASQQFPNVAGRRTLELSAYTSMYDTIKWKLLNGDYIFL